MSASEEHSGNHLAAQHKVIVVVDAPANLALVVDYLAEDGFQVGSMCWC